MNTAQAGASGPGVHPDFVSLVRAQVARYGTSRSYTYLHEVGRELREEKVDYADLDHAARGIAVGLAARPESARPVLLLYVEGIDFLRAFLGCLYAGAVSVPAPLPHDARSLDRLTGIIGDADIGLVLTTEDMREVITGWLRDNGYGDRIACISTSGEPLGDAAAWQAPQLTGESIAFLQYTSGSTGEPKGVVVTHANLLDNEASISASLGVDDTKTCVGWLPHFHDMGLIGMILQVIYVGGNLAFMSPMTFLKRPVRWLDAIDRFRAEFTVAPNFAYELVARRVADDDLARLDLSTLQVALNGAEPIRPHTLDAVTARLGVAGFPPHAFVAGYGMAEVTLLASASIVGRPPVYLAVDAAALEHHRIVPSSAASAARLVGNGTMAHLDGRVGEIWLRGASVAGGYYRRPDETADKFHARTDTGDGPFLRTGDLGALHDGELYITGRLKDLLIVNGRNLYPQDIESFVSRLHPALAESPGIVLSVDTGKEHMVVIQGVKVPALDGVSPADLTADIRASVARAFEVPAPSVMLVEAKAVHRTTSGKVQRTSMRAAFLANEVEALLHETLDPAVATLRDGTQQR